MNQDFLKRAQETYQNSIDTVKVVIIATPAHPESHCNRNTTSPQVSLSLLTTELRPRELHISLASNKSRMPRHLFFVLDQRSNELAMRRPIDRHTLRSAISLPLVDVEETKTTTQVSRTYLVNCDRKPKSNHDHRTIENSLISLCSIRPGGQLNDLRRSDFAHPKRQQARHRPRVQDVTSVQESLVAGRRKPVEPREGLFDRGVQAGCVDGDVRGEVVERGGDGV